MGGAAWHGIRGARNAPRGWGSRFAGFTDGVRSRAPVLGGTLYLICCHSLPANGFISTVHVFVVYRAIRRLGDDVCILGLYIIVCARKGRLEKLSFGWWLDERHVGYSWYVLLLTSRVLFVPARFISSN